MRIGGLYTAQSGLLASRWSTSGVRQSTKRGRRLRGALISDHAACGGSAGRGASRAAILRERTAATRGAAAGFRRDAIMR